MYTPSFYDPKKIETLYMPRLADIEAEADKLTIPSMASDKTGNKVALMLIDMQIDFCLPFGSLYVNGAEKDVERTINFIIANLEKISSIFASLDSHLLFQIFYRTWWRTAANEKPDIFSEVFKSKIDDNTFRPVVDAINSIEYTKKLEAQANKPLCIWPYHTMLGGVGQAIVPALFEILAFHGFARKTQLNFLQKGQIPQTEMYGILNPEVKVPGHPQGGFNTDFINILGKHDKLIVAGEAKSHCVLESLKQMIEFFGQNDPDVLKKIYILEDCMSSVSHPAIDFEAIANAEFDKFRNSGVNIVKSTDLDLTK